MGEISNKAFEVEKIKPNVNMFARKILIMVTIFCWLSIFVEGYDLVVYGVVLPSLMDPNVWGLSSTQAGAMGSYALLGMFFGSVIGGILSDKFGRKLILIAFLLLLSIMMALTSVSNSPEWFGIFRFIAGIGIGGIVPAASALTTEYSPGKYRSLVYVLMYTGFAFGGVAASISGMLFINNFGWRFLFLIGTFPIILIPFIIKFVPESIKFLKSNQQEDKAHKIITKYQISQDILYEESMEEKSNFFTSIFSRKYLRSTLLFSIIYIMAFLLIYGINTWLPQMMKSAGYPMKSSMLFLLTFNLGAIIGGIIAGRAADRFQPKKVISLTYLIAAISIALLSIKFNISLLYFLIAVSGFGTTGSTFVLASYVMKHYDSQNRATAIGVSSAIGRFGAVIGPILVGFIMSKNLGFGINFYMFAFVGLIASIIILLMPSIKQRENV